MSKHAMDRRLRTVQHAATNPYRFGAFRSAVAVLMTFALFVGSSTFFVYRSLANQVRNSALDISGLGADASDSDDGSDLVTPSDQFEGRALNILVSGVDSRYNQDDSGYGDSEELTTIQSDTTMILHISANRSSMTVVSIPRDLITDIPSCGLPDGTRSFAYEGMFNSAFSTGAVTDNLAGGIACTKATVEELSGLTIDGFIVVDFKGFKGMIDALGGVWFNVPEDMHDDFSGLDVQAGCQRFDSFTALAFARARKNVGDGSDISRIGRQQELASAMVREVLSKNFVTDIHSLIQFVQAAIDTLTLSPNLVEINTNAGLLLSFLSVEKSNIRFVTLPWTEAPFDPNRVVAVEPRATRLWNALDTDTDLPIGTEYTDGNGQLQTVPDPNEVPAPTPNAPSENTDTDDQSTDGDTGTNTAPAPQDAAQSVVPCPPN